MSECDFYCLIFQFTYMWLALAGATLPTTGFTRVLARPKGIFSQPRNSAKKPFAVQSIGAISSPAALSRAGVLLIRHTAVRSVRTKKSGCRAHFEGPLSLITDFWKATSNRRCPALGEVDQLPCSTSITTLSRFDRSSDKRSSTLHCRRLCGSFGIHSNMSDFGRFIRLDSANLRSTMVASRPNLVFDGVALCKSSFRHAEPAGSTSVREQIRSSDRVASLRTRNMQRVPYEEGNARQCAAARREPHRHC